MFIMIRCGTVHSTLLHMVSFVTEGIGLEEGVEIILLFLPYTTFVSMKRYYFMI